MPAVPIGAAGEKFFQILQNLTFFSQFLYLSYRLPCFLNHYSENVKKCRKSATLEKCNRPYKSALLHLKVRKWEPWLKVDVYMSSPIPYKATSADAAEVTKVSRRSVPDQDKLISL